MRKNVIIGCLCLSLMLAAGAGLSYGSDEKSPGYPPGEMVIEGKKPAHFNHEKHQKLGLACGTCHHDKDHKELTKEDIVSMENKGALKCVSCHNESFSNAKLNKAMSVFHANCKDCHKKGVEGKKGPAKCTDCHPKKKK